jgi:thioester reductase-like protein
MSRGAGVQGMAGSRNILEPITAHAERDPEALLFAFLDRRGELQESVTREGLLQRTGDLAAHLHRELGLEPGERVILLHSPGLGMIHSFFACVRLGLVPVPVPPPTSHGFEPALHRLAYVARDAEASAILTERSTYWSMEVHRARQRAGGSAGDVDVLPRIPWVVADDAETNPCTHPERRHSNLLFLQYTSGSTREPRGVMVTHENLLHNCEIILDHTPIGVSWLPQFHDLGLIGSYLFIAIRGGTTYGFSPGDFIRRPLLWLETMSRVRATVSAAPNFAYELCLMEEKVRSDRLDPLDLGSLEVLMTAAEPVHPAVYRGFLEQFSRCGLRPRAFVSAYGLAEATLAVSSGGRRVRSFDTTALASGRVAPVETDDLGPGTTTLVSCGRPLRTNEVRIVHVADGLGEAGPRAAGPRGAGPLEVGEVWVRGPSKCPGYWNRPRLSREVFDARVDGDPAHEDGWLRTGDLGFMFEGELHICGRIKDLIIIRGRNVYPQDVEPLVTEDPAVRPGGAAAFGVPGPGGERLVVVAEVRRANRLPDLPGLQARLIARLGISADVVTLVRGRSLPKTTSGKLQRQEARRRWEEGAFQVIGEHEAPAPGGFAGEPSMPGTDAAPGSPVRSRLGPLLRRHRLTGMEAITLGEAGLDSLSITELAAEVEHCMRDVGAGDLVGTVDVRWLRTIAVSELVGLLEDLATAAPTARLRFRRAFAGLEREHREAEVSAMERDARFIASPAPEDGHRAARGNPGGAILLTGGTGFFGPFLLQQLLERRTEDLHVLVRARDAEEGGARLWEGLAGLDPADPTRLRAEFERRVVPVPGDLAQAGLGLASSAWRHLVDSVEEIYHNGARVNYLDDYAALRAPNVGGTSEVVRLALGGRPKVMNLVSSTFVFGWSTRPTLDEAHRNRDLELLDFGYSQSKWVSEEIVFDAMSQGLEARVFRPALIAPSVAGGGSHFDIAIRLLAFMIRHGIGTTARNQVSLSPADVTARNLVAISLLPGTTGRTYHMTRDRYECLEDVTRCLEGSLGVAFTHHSLDRFVPLVIERCRPTDLLFPLLNFLVRSVDRITAMEFKRYDNRNYREARDRSPLGVPDPPLDEVVLGIVRFMARQGILEAPAAGASATTFAQGGQGVR